MRATDIGRRYRDGFAMAVRLARVERGLRQEEVCEAAGLGRNYLTTLESRGCNPSLEAMAKVAYALGTPLSALLEHAARLSSIEQEVGRGA